tara:strand:+ start:197 stop:508 length:312 start_codon:yes stop_codon:yes gene_type:complete
MPTFRTIIDRYIKKTFFGQRHPLDVERIDYNRVQVKITKIKKSKKAHTLIDNHLAYFNSKKLDIDIDKLITNVQQGSIEIIWVYNVDLFIKSMKKIGCQVKKI